MLRCFLRAKIHMGVVTEADLAYEGSITVDKSLLEKTGIKPYEKVHVSNVNNGKRFETYIIPGKPGQICLNGPTARKGAVGDRVIIFNYCWLGEDETADFKPVIIKLNTKNRIIK
ncbi:MAG: aspartate 1-decarboxylase [Nitrospiraceae bacterium]|nr:aspartate 1-decarboxylase [Nitrospiraceae bacterium]